MKLASILTKGTKDGQLIVVSTDGSRYLPPASFITLQQALENWETAKCECHALSEKLEHGEGAPLSSVELMAPLPRAWQWLDGSAFNSHADLMQQAFDQEPMNHDKPLMYQGMSHQFVGPYSEVPFLNENDGIDFEGEFGVIVDEVPMGISAEHALQHIKLLVLINDWSLRNLAMPEMLTGFGWIQAKPACSMAPFAVTPDEAGENWQNGRLNLELEVNLNKHLFGKPNGTSMSVGFHDLIAHAAATRPLCAGTIIGSGTVSNTNYQETGSTCIAEKRGIEIIQTGKPITDYMKFGDHIEMLTKTPNNDLLFGKISQRVKRHKAIQ